MRALDLHIRKIEGLQVFVFNVGQGDHLMVRLPSGAYGIIDYFYTKPFKKTPALMYFETLRLELGVSKFQEEVKVEFLCLSHYDLDHVKGFYETFNWLVEAGCKIEKLWLPASDSKDIIFNQIETVLDNLMRKNKELRNEIRISRTAYSKEAKKFLDRYPTFKRRSKHLRDLQELRKFSDKEDQNIIPFSLGPLEIHYNAFDQLDTLSVGIQLLDRNHEKFSKELLKKVKGGQDANIISHILWLKTSKNQNLYFGGDAHYQVWRDSLDEYGMLSKGIGSAEPACFVKASHHGSYTSSEPDLWEQLSDSDSKTHIAVSAGHHDRFKHPSDKWLEDVKANGNCKIHAVNACDACVNKQSMNSITFEWMDASMMMPPRMYRKYNEKALEKIQNSLNRIGKREKSSETKWNQEEKELRAILNQKYSELESDKSQKTLAAYIFDVTDNGVVVNKAVSRRANGYPTCFFKGRERLPSC